MNNRLFTSQSASLTAPLKGSLSFFSFTPFGKVSIIMVRKI